MKTLKKLSFLFLIVITMFGLSSVRAVNTKISGNARSVQNLTVTKNVENVKDNVTNIFTYTISADSNNPGEVTGLPSTMSIEFNNVIPNSSNVATQIQVLDLSGVIFTELGDYKFTIEETASSNASVYPIDITHSYTIYASVRNELCADGKTPTGNLIATFAGQVKNNDVGAKTDILFETEPLTSLSITKSVTGNIAEKDQYFKFKVVIKSTVAGTYTISGQDAIASYGGQTVSTSSTYTKGQDNYVYLKHGQTVTIGLNGTTPEIDAGDEYQIIEQDATDYNTYINGSTTDSKASILTELSNDSSKNNVSFVNYKETAALTGLFINVLPFILLILLAIVGIFIIRKTEKNNKV